MTKLDITTALGISGLRTISENSRVFELANGFVHPPTELELKMWNFIQSFVK